MHSETASRELYEPLVRLLGFEDPQAASAAAQATAASAIDRRWRW
jgi:hypothetical protein